MKFAPIFFYEVRMYDIDLNEMVTVAYFQSAAMAEEYCEMLNAKGSEADVLEFQL